MRVWLGVGALLLAVVGLGVVALAHVFAPLWSFPRHPVDELQCADVGTYRLYRTRGLGGQDWSEITLQPPGGDERLVLGTFRSPDVHELSRSTVPVELRLENGQDLRLDHAALQALHRNDRFRFVYDGRLESEPRRNEDEVRRRWLWRWGGLVLVGPLAAFACWMWLRRSRVGVNAA